MSPGTPATTVSTSRKGSRPMLELVEPPVPSARPVQVLLYGGSPLIRAGLARMLQGHSDRVVLRAPEDRGRPPSVDLILVDLEDPPDGPVARPVRLVGCLARSGTATAVLSWRAEVLLVRAVSATGAAGFLHKSLDTETLLDGLVRLGGGGARRTAVLHGRGVRSRHREAPPRRAAPGTRAGGGDSSGVDLASRARAGRTGHRDRTQEDP